MTLKEAKRDAQLLANRLKCDWLIVRTDIAGNYKIVQEEEADKKDKQKTALKINPNYETIGTARNRARAYRARRVRELKKNENMRKKTI